MIAIILMLLTIATTATVSYAAEPVIGTLRSDAAVRSGPGDEFYETSQLKAGDSVSVYANDEGEWCAIRPPLGSFSWVSGSGIRVGLDNIGVATYDKIDEITVRIGSETTDLCNAIQVSLRDGERVLILGRAHMPTDADNPVWYKISPPSGEFRYVRRSDLDLRVAPPKLKATPAVIEPVSYQWNVTDATEVSAAPQTLPSLTPQEFARSLDELKREVDLAIRQPTEDWVFETLHHETQRLLNSVPPPSEAQRQKLQQMVNALSKTQMVRKEIAQRRAIAQVSSASRGRAAAPALNSLLPNAATTSPTAYQHTARTVPNTATVPPTVTATPATMRPVAYREPNANNAATTFAVEGTLGRFTPAPPGYPPYAIIDAQQQLVCLVTPERGVSLEQLVGRRVGLDGTLGAYQTAEGASLRHLTARIAVAQP